MKKMAAVLLALLLCGQGAASLAAPADAGEEAGEEQAEGPQVSAPCVFLMEASTGTVVYERQADEKRPPASVTKIMTLLLIFDALAQGRISLADEVTVSEYAASMGGSQVFLEAGEVQTVETLIKCIAVASANDACVAMAEYTEGSEEAFVAQMNRRAAGLGMENTSFVNCNGLDAEGHLTTARDIALMSRELLLTYPQVKDYALIWMEDITHVTAKGSSPFTLANTNRLVRQYAGATGLKTGSTDEAGFCISASARKNSMDMIAVVLGAPTSKERFADAAALLDYGFGKCVLYADEGREEPDPVPVRGGVADTVRVRQMEPFTYVDTQGADLTKIQKEFRPSGALKAPVETGDAAGEVVYSLEGKEIGSAPLGAAGKVERATYESSLLRALEDFFVAGRERNVAKQAG